jgi:hypothetical protein
VNGANWHLEQNVLPFPPNRARPCVFRAEDWCLPSEDRRRMQTAARPPRWVGRWIGAALFAWPPMRPRWVRARRCPSCCGAVPAAKPLPTGVRRASRPRQAERRAAGPPPRQDGDRAWNAGTQVGREDWEKRRHADWTGSRARRAVVGRLGVCVVRAVVFFRGGSRARCEAIRRSGPIY